MTLPELAIFAADIQFHPVTLATKEFINNHQFAIIAVTAVISLTTYVTDIFGSKKS